MRKSSQDYTIGVIKSLLVSRPPTQPFSLQEIAAHLKSYDIVVGDLPRMMRRIRESGCFLQVEQVPGSSPRMFTYTI